MGGQITEAEFWEGREVRPSSLYRVCFISDSCCIQHLLLAQTASERQKRGRPGQLVDPRPETVEGGEVKIVITPQLVHDIFEEYPVVAKAYSDNVPNKVCLTHVS
jgi:transcription initiation factor TFIIH subunit 1